MQNDSSGLVRLQGKAIEGLITTNTQVAAANYAGCSNHLVV